MKRIMVKSLLQLTSSIEGEKKNKRVDRHLAKCRKIGIALRSIAWMLFWWFFFLYAFESHRIIIATYFYNLFGKVEPRITWTQEFSTNKTMLECMVGETAWIKIPYVKSIYTFMFRLRVIHYATWHNQIRLF